VAAWGCGSSTPLVVVLIPEDTTLPAMVAQTEAKDGLQRAEFRDVTSGAYLLSLYPGQRGEAHDTR
jgi:hypothetical protein